MILYSAFVLLVSLALSEASDCSTCTEPSVPPSVWLTCNVLGQLIAQCPGEKISSEKSSFDRLTCIDGEWFGTSCDGSAKFLGGAPEKVVCGPPAGPCYIPHFDPYDGPYGGYFHTHRRELAGPERSFQCIDRMFFHSFRRGDPFRIIENMFDPVVCKIDNTREDGYYFINPEDGDPVYELLFNQVLDCRHIMCPWGFLMFPEFDYDANTGRCVDTESVFEGAAARAYVSNCNVDGNVFDGVPLELGECEPYHITVAEDCKCTVFGKAELLSDKTVGAYKIPTTAQSYLMIYSKAKSVQCTCPGKSKTINVTIGGTPNTFNWEFSHESRYVSFEPTVLTGFQRDSIILGPSNPFRVGASLSITATATDGMILRPMTGTGSQDALIGINFPKSYYSVTPSSEQEVRKPFNSTIKEYNLQIVNTDRSLTMYLNGQPVSVVSMPNIAKWSRIEIERYDMAVHNYYLFIPKECPPDHIFSRQTGDCKFTGDESLTTLVTTVDGTSTWISQGEFGLEKEVLKATVRAGCVAKFYTKNNTLLYTRDSYSLVTPMGSVNLPTLAAGTAQAPWQVGNSVVATCRDSPDEQDQEEPVPHQSSFANADHEPTFMFGDSIHVKGKMLGDFSIDLLSKTNLTLFSVQPLMIDRLIVTSGPDFGKLSGSVDCRTFSLAENEIFDIVLLNKPHAVEVYVNGVIIPPMRHRTKYPEEDYAYVKIDGDVQLLGVRKTFIHNPEDLYDRVEYNY